MDNILQEINTPTSYFICTIIVLALGYIRQNKIFAKPEDLTALELKLKQQADERFLSKELYEVVQDNISEKFDKVDETLLKIQEQNSEILSILIGNK